MTKKQKKTIKEEIKEEIEKTINHSWDGTLYALNKNTLEYIDVTDIIFEDLLRKTLQRFIEETKLEMKMEEIWNEFEEKFGIDARCRYEGYETSRMIWDILERINQKQQQWLKENL